MSIFVLGIDLGKNVCSLVGLDESGSVVLRRRLRRDGVEEFVGKLPACIVAMAGLLDDLKLFFNDPWERDRLDTHETTDGDHGRIEVRRHWVCNDVAWLTGMHPWKGLACIAMVEATREIDGKASTSRRFYIASAPLDARRFAAAVRAHWTIENQLHWVMDVVFHDDLCRLRTGHAAANMAAIRHIAVNLVDQANDKASRKVRRKKAAWSTDYLEALLRGTA